jgi:MoaA/NifB/PqqE/SkfB family radical SAM enzyme
MQNNETAYSNLKIFAHPQKLDAIKRGEVTAPIYVRIKPTNACNHGCNYCHYGSGQYLELKGAENRNQIQWEKLQEIINDLGDIGTKAVTFSGGGEPLFYKNITDAIKLVKSRNIDLSIITNGHFLNGEKAELLSDARWVRISFDAATAGTYSALRNIEPSAFDLVCENIKNFAKIKKDFCEFGINFVVNAENAGEVYDAGKMLHGLGVNHIKFTAKMCNDVHSYHAPVKNKVIEQIHRLKAELEKPRFAIINLYEHDFDNCAVFQRKYNKCRINEIVTVVAADSKIYFCHDKAYLANGVIGDLQRSTFKEIWFSKETKDLFAKFDPMAECRHHCVYDDRNILLNRFFSINDNHINFI